jgi:hypothetical protein
MVPPRFARAGRLPRDTQTRRGRLSPASLSFARALRSHRLLPAYGRVPRPRMSVAATNSRLKFLPAEADEMQECSGLQRLSSVASSPSSPAC